MAAKKDLEKRVQSLENFRWRVRNAIKSLIEKDISETSLDSVREYEDEHSIMSSKSDSDTEVDMEIKTELVEEHPNLGNAHFVVEIASTLVWPLLKDWLLKKDGEGNRKFRFSKFFRLIDPRNLHQALADRNAKAETKYGTGLTVEDGNHSFQPAVEKLSDSVYFLFKTMHHASQLYAQNPNEYNRQLNIVTDLHSLLGTFISELKGVKINA